MPSDAPEPAAAASPRQTVALSEGSAALSGTPTPGYKSAARRRYRRAHIRRLATGLSPLGADAVAITAVALVSGERTLRAALLAVTLIALYSVGGHYRSRFTLSGLPKMMGTQGHCLESLPSSPACEGAGNAIPCRHTWFGVSLDGPSRSRLRLSLMLPSAASPGGQLSQRPAPPHGGIPETPLRRFPQTA